jgi:hypothetical protein
VIVVGFVMLSKYQPPEEAVQSATDMTLGNISPVPSGRENHTLRFVGSASTRLELRVRIGIDAGAGYVHVDANESSILSSRPTRIPKRNCICGGARQVPEFLIGKVTGCPGQPATLVLA